MLDIYLPKDKQTRYDFINELRVNCTFTLYRYYHGNYLGTLNFIWKIPEITSEQNKNQEAQMLALANEMIPTYFTRQMRKNVIEKVFLILLFYFILLYFICLTLNLIIAIYL